MGRISVRVKGIIKKEEKYLVLKRWYDDRIPDPFMWEFIDGEVNFGEKPDAAVVRNIFECLNVEGSIDKISYTWSNVVGDTQIIGIAYLCSITENEEFNLSEAFGGYEWIEKADFESYIENQYVLKDILSASL